MNGMIRASAGSLGAWGTGDGSAAADVPLRLDLNVSDAGVRGSLLGWNVRLRKRTSVASVSTATAPACSGCWLIPSAAAHGCPWTS